MVKLFFLTLHADFCSELSCALQKDGFESKVFTTIDTVRQALMTEGFSKTLIVLDYFFFAKEIENACTFLHKLVQNPKEDGAFPTVFYNSPFCPLQTFSLFSLSYLERKMQDFLPLHCIDDIWIALCALQKVLIVSQSHSPPPADVFSLLADVRKKSHIQAAKWNLLMLLAEHHNTALSQKELTIQLFDTYTPEHVKTLYSYISALKKELLKAQAPVCIERTAKKCYTLSVFSPNENTSSQNEPSPCTSTVRAFLSLPPETAITFA